MNEPHLPLVIGYDTGADEESISMLIVMHKHNLEPVQVFVGEKATTLYEILTKGRLKNVSIFT